jgi:orotidine-5'-phosphate decarboxylase
VNSPADPKLILALDFPSQRQALELVERLSPHQCRLKVGKELFTRCGPALVERLVQQGFEVFLDLKFHDIPNTVAAACAVAADLGVWMVNVHAGGGRRMMEAARERLLQVAEPPLLIAVTVLTSMGLDDLRQVGVDDEPQRQVLRLAALARDAGLDGVVCSPREATPLRDSLGADFKLVTPGVRPAWAGADDQRRVMTPREALAAGAHYLVVGRPITRAEDPRAAADRVLDEMHITQ